MRAKLSAGVVVALALLIPAAPAAAAAATPGLNAACQTVERKVYRDIRKSVNIDLDTASDVQVRMVADRILYEANTEALPLLPQAVQQRLDGTPDDLRTFLKSGLEGPWSTALRISVDVTMPGAGPHVKAAAQKVLDEDTVEAYLAYLNDGVYAARALDCASKPTTKPSVTPSTTTPATAIPSASTSRGASGGNAAGNSNSGGTGGGLPVTGSDTATVAAIGGALLLLGGAGYVIARRRRSRFVA